jgi:hypothetical protein
VTSAGVGGPSRDDADDLDVAVLLQHWASASPHVSLVITILVVFMMMMFFVALSVIVVASSCWRLQ